jgi:hypothetical protein
MAPLFPEETPELKITYPLTPLVPPLPVPSHIFPLEVSVPTPLTNFTRPPLMEAESPAAIIKSPDPLLPEPTVMYMDPPRLLDEEPDPMNIVPLFTPAAPELKTMKPLLPRVFDASAVVNSMLPLDPPAALVPEPVWIKIRPPEMDPEVPALNTRSPPYPELPDPAAT